MAWAVHRLLLYNCLIFIVASALATSARGELRTTTIPTKECAIKYGRLIPRIGTLESGIVEMAHDLGGDLNVLRSANGKVVFEIDLPRKDTPRLPIRRVTELPDGASGLYEFPRLEIRIEPGIDEKEVVIISGRARGIVEKSTVFLDGKVSDGLGLRIQIPDAESDPVVIDAGLSSMKNLTDPKSKLSVVPMLDAAADLLRSVAPNRMTILNARGGRYLLRPGSTKWESAN
jgi:hypothetical protein